MVSRVKKQCHVLRLKSVVVFALALITTLTPLQRAYAIDTLNEGYQTFYSQNDILFYDPNAVVCNTAVSPTGSVSLGLVDTSAVASDFNLGTDNALRAVNLAKQMMIDYNLTEAQAAGIVGNFMHESGGKHVPPDINEGTKTPAPPAFKGGYGWAQWTGSRQTTFIDYVIKHGYIRSKADRATDAANYAYLKYELTQTEVSTLPAVRAATTAQAAAIAFEDKFERAGKPLMEYRIKYANELYSALKNGAGIDMSGTTTAPPSSAVECTVSGAGAVTTGSIFSNVVFPLTVKRSDVKNNYIFHDGTTDRAGHPYIAFDILAAAGTQVVALTNGTVSRVNPDSVQGGGVTVYNAEKKLHVFYTHLRPDPSIKKGDTISPGQVIGKLLSVKDYPAINADHLHIDAGTGELRLECSRSAPNGAACNNRVDIGPDLFNAWEKITP